MKIFIFLILVIVANCYKFEYTSSRTCGFVFFPNTSHFYNYYREINSIISYDMFNMKPYDENNFNFLHYKEQLTDYLMDNNIITYYHGLNTTEYNYDYEHEYKKYCMYNHSQYDITIKETHYPLTNEPEWFYDYMMYFDELLYTSYKTYKPINIIDIKYVDDIGHTIFNNILSKYIINHNGSYHAIMPYKNRQIFTEDDKFNILKYITDYFVFIIIFMGAIIIL